MNDIQIVEDLLKKSKCMVVAVTLSDNTPWVVPVTIKHRDGYKALEWDSSDTTVHSEAIANNPSIALTIFSAEDDIGFYAQAVAVQIPNMINAHGQVRYRATIKRCWLNEAFTKREIK